MGKIESKVERIILVLILCFTGIMLLAIYKMPVVSINVNMIYILLAILVVTIFAIVFFSCLIHILKTIADIKRESELLKQRQESELEKEHKLIYLRDLSKRKELEYKQLLMDMDFESYKAKELFKKENGLK